jgi:hypothetical protein
VSYAIAAYGITALSLALYTLHLHRERERERKTLERSQESNNG